MSTLRAGGILTLITSALSYDICYSAISGLAQYDKLFGEAPADPSHSREIQKETFGALDSTTDDFVDDMRAQRSQGTGFSCGYTASWVTEIFSGLGSQFPRYRLGDYGNETTPNTKSGYLAAAGQELTDLFTRYATIGDRVVIKLVHSPPVDHQIVIEQLPSQAGYRVYQSYNSAHSLAAWLSSRSTNLSKLYDNGFIMSSPKIVPVFSAALQGLFGPTVNLDNYMDVPDAASPLVPLLKAYMSYFLSQNTRASVLANFRLAKEQYGEGKIISKSEFFGTYLPKTAAVSAFLTQSWGTDTPFPQYVADYWLDLYGTPNLMIFPGAPVNLVPSLLGLTAQYYSQVLTTVVPDEIQCILNRNLLAWSLLAPGRREAIPTMGLEDLPSEQKSSGLQLTATGFAGIIIAAAICVGIAMVVAFRMRQRHSHIEKPVPIDLELSTVVSIPSP